MHVLGSAPFFLFLRPPKSQLKKVVGQNGKQDAHGVSKKAHPNDEQIQRNRTFVTLFRASFSTRCSRHRKDIVTSFSTTQDFSLHGYLSENHVGLFSQFDNSRFSILERDFNTGNPSLHLLSPRRNLCQLGFNLNSLAKVSSTPFRIEMRKKALLDFSATPEPLITRPFVTSIPPQSPYLLSAKSIVWPNFYFYSAHPPNELCFTEWLTFFHGVTP